MTLHAKHPEICRWTAQTSSPALPLGEVHVWRIAVDRDAAAVARLQPLLSQDERVRTERFHFELDRSRYIVAHAALRIILAGYLARDPAQVLLRGGAGAKPRLAQSAEGTDLCFNLAHSGDLALCAVARGREVGVDIEHTVTSVDVLEIARGAFAEDEVRSLIAAPEALRRNAFYRLWTCKEAYVKATGEGLARPPASFCVQATDGETPRLLWVRDAPCEAERWTLRTLIPERGYVAALAVEGHDWRLRCWQLSW